MMRCLPVVVLGMAAALSCADIAAAQNAFWNFETPPVNPLAMTPDGSKLIVCNTADARVEVFSLAGTTPLRIGSIAVGVDPVSVRCRTNTEAWVVNAISDSVSIVNLTTMNVKRTLSVGDEPMDVVFAGSPQRAFISISQRNQVRVFDPVTLAEIAGSPIGIAGEDPRALAVSADGSKVYVAIFESGNRAAIVPAEVVSNPASPYGGQNPPPNFGTIFNPPFNPALPPAPAVSLIVHKENGEWMDDNNRVWDALVPYNTHDNDVVAIDPNSIGVAPAPVTGLSLNIIMNLAVNPANGRVTAIGLRNTNEIRFEPNLRSKFARVSQGTFNGSTLAFTGGGDLNPHLEPYTATSIPQAQRDLSLGDPRGAVWDSTGTQLYVAGMGSNSVIVTNASNVRLATINVGQGPSGLALDAPRNRVYCLNRFDGTISIISTLTNTESLPRVSFFDPTPSTIKVGRPFLYNTHLTSGLGQTSCATCHIDAKMDNEAWDLGDPSGVMKAFNQVCNAGIPVPGSCGDWHPMKGPMTTQTLVGIINNGPMHWRGDRENISAFTVGFTGLLGDDAPPSPVQMIQFQDFLGTIRFPPQPNRTMFDGVPPAVSGFIGNPQNGQNLFNTALLDGGALTCVACHTMPMGGANSTLISANFLLISQSMKVPQLRNMYEKTGFSTTSIINNRGFGFTHDGALANLFDFLHSGAFTFPAGAAGDAQRRDLEAFLMCFPTDTHPAVGMQTTVIDGPGISPTQQSLINQMIALAGSNNVGLIVKGRLSGIDRGFMYNRVGSNFQSDRSAQSFSPTALVLSAGPNSELTYTVVAIGTQRRMGIDRDADGFFDRDELDVCSNPADASETPANVCVADATSDHAVNVDDLLAVIVAWGQTGPVGAIASDIAPGCGDGTVSVDDLLSVITHWGACP